MKNLSAWSNGWDERKGRIRISRLEGRRGSACGYAEPRTANPRRGISVSSRRGWGPAASELKMTPDLAVLVLGLLLLSSISTGAQGRSPSSNPTSAAGEVTLTASSANVSQPGDPVRIDIFRWSTDEERRPIVDALNTPSAPPATPPTAN